MHPLRQFAIDTCGQDLIEYVLLLALMVIATTAMLVTAGQSQQVAVRVLDATKGAVTHHDTPVLMLTGRRGGTQ